MLSRVLKSKRAIQINSGIMRAFVKIRQVLATHKDVVRKLEEIGQVQRRQGIEISSIWQVLNQMTKEKTRKRYRIGFRAE